MKAFAYICAFTAIFLTVGFVNQDPTENVRKELASEIFNYLFEHAVCVEQTTASQLIRQGKLPLESLDFRKLDAPCDWVSPDAYSLHWSAKELWSNKPLKDIKMPESEWGRGGYEKYFNPIDYLDHQAIKLRVWLLINYGTEGIPPRQ